MGRDARLDASLDQLTAQVLAGTTATGLVDAAIDLVTAELAPLESSIDDVATALATLGTTLNAGSFVVAVGSESSNVITFTITSSVAALQDFDFELVNPTSGTPLLEAAFTAAIGASGTLLTTTAKSSGTLRTTAGGVATLAVTDVATGSSLPIALRVRRSNQYVTGLATFDGA